MANEYLSLEEFKATLELSQTTFADEDAHRSLEAASRAIDLSLGRVFYQGAPGEVRYYSPTGFTSVTIDDAFAVTAVAIDPSDSGTWTPLVAATDYYLEPRNAAALGFPYTVIRSRPAVGWVSRWDTPFGWASRFDNIYPNTVRVTATYGWPAPPPGIVTATAMIASRLVKRLREAPFGVVGFGMDGSAVRIARDDPDVAALLAPFNRSPLLI